MADVDWDVDDDGCCRAGLGTDDQLGENAGGKREGELVAHFVDFFGVPRDKRISLFGFLYTPIDTWSKILKGCEARL